MPYKNREDEKNYQREWYQKNKDREQKKHREYSQKPENKENHKEYYQKNKEKCVAQSFQYQKDNPDKFRRNLKKYAKTEKGKACEQRKDALRRAGEREIINTLTAGEWLEILKEYKFKCAYCNKEFTLFDRETRDHVIPISKGGDNTKENVVPACKSCNSAKRNKILGGNRN